MKLETAAPTNKKAAALAAASEAAGARSGADPAIAECPLKTRIATLNIVLWHITELGGGPTRPTKRPDYAINAMAAVLAKVKADVCIITGIERTDGAKVVGDEDETRFQPGTDNSGAAEADRLLTAMRNADAGGSWMMTLPPSQDNTIPYEDDRTVAILYRTSDGQRRTALEILDGSLDGELDMGQHVVWCSFRFPSRKGPTVQLDVITPLGGAAVESTIKPTAPQIVKPKSFLLAVSSLDDIVANQARLHSVRSALGAEMRPLVTEGTVVQRAFWDTVWDTSHALLESYAVVNPADVRLADDAMHWESLENPEHPDTVDEVAGKLYDAIFICNGDPTPRYRVKEIRVVDLVRAALAADELTTLQGNGPARDEDSSIAKQRTAFRRDAGYLAEWSVKDDPANVLAECVVFSQVLSDHWPLLAIVDVKPEQ